MKSTIETVTPDIAKRYLRINGHNRPISKGVVEKYAYAMIAEQWELNGEPIILDENNVLMDGQHRLQAVVMADIPVDMLIVTGVNKKCFDTINTGKNRSASDVLSIEGFAPNTARIAASTARLNINFNRKTGRINTGVLASARASNHHVSEHVRGNVELVDAVEHILSYPTRNSPIQGGWAAFLLLLMREQEPDLADEYMQQIMTGKLLDDADPAYHVRLRLERNERAKTRKMSQFLKACVVSKGWYYFLKGTFPSGDNAHANAFKQLDHAFQVYLN